MVKGSWHVMTGLLMFWLLILIYMSTSLFQSGESPELMEQQLLKALRDVEKLRRQNGELQALSLELKELKNSIQRENPEMDALKQKLEVANQRLRRATLLKLAADNAGPENGPNLLAPQAKDGVVPQAESAPHLPSVGFEQLRRQISNGVLEFWFYMQSELSSIKTKLGESEVATDVTKIIQNGADHQQTIMKDLFNLTTLSGPSGWQEKEAKDLSDIVQRRLHHLQNPKDCSTAKKLVCNINKGCGYGCQLHHVVYCFIVAYGTGRTMVLESKDWTYQREGWTAVFQPVSDTCTDPTGSSRRQWKDPATIDNVQVVDLPIVDGMHPRPDFMPQAIPEDLAPRLLRLHGNPFVWWVGQFLKFLLRPQPHLQEDLVATEKRLGFMNPIVGVHVRRTDKVGTEAAFHGIEEYMGHVENYYSLLQKIRSVDKKRVYLATDDQKLLEEAKKKYPDYEFVGDSEFAKTAGLSSRYTDTSLLGIIMDIHFLSKTNYLVCTFSSQVCRVAYEIMQTMHPDASAWYHSLDDIYYYGGQNAHDQVAMYAHTAQEGSKEIALSPGDKVGIAGNHWNGYSKGRNRRTGAIGLYPSYKVRDVIPIASFPTYAEADKTNKRR